MHSVKVTNFPQPTTARQPFVTVEIELGEDRHITTLMSKTGTSSVTVFVNSLADVRQLADELQAQVEKEELKCQ
jgi:hypothetical protein